MSRWGGKQPSKADAKGQLVAFLYNCRDNVLATTTVDELVSRYGVARIVAEYELTIARQKRAA